MYNQKRITMKKNKFAIILIVAFLFVSKSAFAQEIPGANIISKV